MPITRPMTMPMRRQLIASTAALIARDGIAPACAVSSGIHRTSGSGIGSTVLCRPERLLDALHHRIEHGLAGDWINECEAADHAATTTEHDLLVEDVLIALAREYEPSLTSRCIVEVVTG